MASIRTVLSSEWVYQKTGNPQFDNYQAKVLSRKIRTFQDLQSGDPRIATPFADEIENLRWSWTQFQNHEGSETLTRSNESVLGLSCTSSCISDDCSEVDAFEFPKISDEVKVYTQFESAVIQDYHNRIQWLESLISDDEKVKTIIESLITIENDRYKEREAEYKQNYELSYRPREEYPIFHREYSSIHKLLADYKYKIIEQNQERLWILRSLNVDQSLFQYVEKLREFDAEELVNEKTWIDCLGQNQNISLSRSESSSSESSSNFSMDAEELEAKFENGVLQAYRSRIDWLSQVEIENSSPSAKELIQSFIDLERNMFQQKEEIFLRDHADFYKPEKVLETRSVHISVDDFIEAYCKLIKDQQEHRRAECTEVIEALDDLELLKPGMGLIIDDLTQSERQISMVRQAVNEGIGKQDDFFEALQIMARNRLQPESSEEEDFIGALRIMADNRPQLESPKLASPLAKQESKQKIGFSKIGVLNAGIGFAAYYLGSKLFQEISLPPMNFTTEAPVLLSCLGSRVVDVMANVGSPVIQLFNDAVTNFSLETAATFMKHSIESYPNALAYSFGAIGAIATISQYFMKKNGDILT